MRCEGMSWSLFFRKQAESQACSSRVSCDGVGVSRRVRQTALRTARRVMARDRRDAKEVSAVVRAIVSSKMSARDEMAALTSRALREGYAVGPGCSDGCLAVHEKCECWKRRVDDVAAQRDRAPLMAMLAKAAKRVLEAVSSDSRSGAPFPWEEVEQAMVEVASAKGIQLSKHRRALHYDARANRFVPKTSL